MATAFTKDETSKRSIERPTSNKETRSLGPWALNRVHNVECKTALRQMPDECLDIAITSPPYWGQRGTSGIGAEENPRDYVSNLVEILAEVMRCLKPTGTLWLNIGDSYNTPINWRFDDYNYSTLGSEGAGLSPNNSAYTKNRGRRRACVDRQVPWLQYGNLLAVPWRVVLGLCDRGFLLRGEIIWVKSRPLPEGRCRRPHRKHEGIYIIAKNEAHAFRIIPPVASVWSLVQTPNKTPHCSTFPLDLPIKCIEATGLVSGVVLDPFMGSGTTGKAAAILGMDYVGFELDKRNCSIATDYIAKSERPLLS